MANPEPITKLLLELSAGNRKALDDLLPLVYEELRRLAHQRLRRERAGHTLSATAVAHEAYLRLVDEQQMQWQNRAHFFAVASTAMRRILVDYARARARDKRGGGAITVAVDAGLEIEMAGDTLEIIVLDQMLSRLAAMSERACRVLECRVFGGLSIEETGAALGIAPMTVKRDWMFAKTWLRREMGSA